MVNPIDRKSVVSFMVLILVCLQVLLPLIHAHPVGSQLGNNIDGFHIHNEASSTLISQSVPLVQQQDGTHDVVGVPNANETKKLVLPKIVLYCLFIIAILSSVLAVGKHLWFEQFFPKRQNPSYTLRPLRAPPL